MKSLVEEIIDYLRYKQECGERTIELEPETLAVLAAPGVPAAKISVGITEPAVPVKVAETVPKVSPGSPPAAYELPKAPPAPFASRTDTVRPAPIEPRQNGDGKSGVDLFVVGETEAIQAERYGEVLSKMITAMGYSLSEIVLTNICGKPRSDKPPTAAEMKAAMPAFTKKVRDANPKVILLLGSTAALGILGKQDISSIHGKWFNFDGIPLMPTYHPAYLIKFPQVKRDAWSDLQRVMVRLGKKV